MTPRLTALLLVFGAAASLASAAGAQTVHKCTVDGKVTYTEFPCQGGSASVIPVPQSPAPDKSGAAELRQMKKEADKLEAARHKRESADDKEDARTNRELAKRHQACEKLKLDKRWAEQDLRRAQPRQEEQARIKVQRAADKLKLSCGS